MKNFVFSLILMIAVFSCAIPVKHVQKGTTGLKNGIFYTLPQTAIVLEIPIKTITYTTGDCYECLKEFLDAELVKKLDVSPKKEYSIAKKQFSMSTLPIKDPSKIYFVSLKRHPTKDKGITFSYNEEGFLTAGEVTNTDKTFDIALAVVSAVAGLRKFEPEQKVKKDCKDKENCTKKKDRFLNLKAIRKKFLEEKYITDGKVLEIQLAALEAEEKGILSSTYQVTETFDIVKARFIPGKDTKDQLVFEFDEKTGKLVFDKIFNEQDVVTTYANASISDKSLAKGYKININNFTDQAEDIYADKEHRNSKKPDNYIVYNIPRKTKVKLSDDNDKVLVAQTIEMPQRGGLGYLPTKLSKLSFDFDPNTGALRKVSASSDALISSEKVGQVSDLATKLKPEKSDSLAALEKEKTYWENKKKISDAKKALGVEQ